MALFIGRIPSDARPSDLEDLFGKYGKINRCDVKTGTSFNFGFVEFEDKRDAEDVVKAHEDKEFELFGNRIVVEMAKGKKREPGDRPERSNGCFKCGKDGHWARDCPDGDGRDSRDRYRRDDRRRSRSRSRSPYRRRDDRDDRYRRDDRDRRDRRDRSPERRGRDRSPARSPARSRERGIEWLHVDIMDGHFVPNLTFGPVVFSHLRKSTSLFLDCHFMVTNPIDYIKIFADNGCGMFTFHYETGNVKEVIKKVKEMGMKCGLALKPATSVDVVEEFVNDLDLVLVMTVEPGFGGQKMIEACLEKAKTLRRLHPHLDIQVDGGISASNIDIVAKSGANLIVSGSGVFGVPEDKQGEVVKIMKDAVQQEIASR